jgi:aspartate aminotransferase-like enzyme
METVGQRIVERAAQRVVGRERELGVLCETLAEDGPLVAFVHAETSTGVLSDAKTLVEIAHRHDALAIVDTVTSLGGSPVCSNRP